MSKIYNILILATVTYHKIYKLRTNIMNKIFDNKYITYIYNAYSFIITRTFSNI